MMGNPEEAEIGAKKQYEALIDDSINNMAFGDKNEARDQVQTQLDIQ